MDLKLKIVNFLSRNMERDFTINEISKFLGEYYSFVHRTTSKLIKEEVVVKKKAGKSYLCSLNLENEKTVALIQLSEMEKRDEFYQSDKELKLILEDFVRSIESEDVITIILFGSYAKGAARKKSDIDVFLVSEREINIDKISKEIYAKYGKEINTIVMTPDQFKKQKDKTLIKEIISNHYVLYGVENFVKMVLGK